MGVVIILDDPAGNSYIQVNPCGGRALYRSFSEFQEVSVL